MGGGGEGDLLGVGRGDVQDVDDDEAVPLLLKFSQFLWEIRAEELGVLYCTAQYTTLESTHGCRREEKGPLGAHYRWRADQ